jgi:hypothetical protein
MQTRTHQTLLLPKFYWIAALMTCVSCAASAPPPTAPPVEYVPAEMQPGMGRSIISESTLDVDNQYAFTVSVAANGRGVCGGVVIDPVMVVTAGHCVCAKRRVAPSEAPSSALIDSSTCLSTASVTAVTYMLPRDGSSKVLSETQVVTGVVRPHEDLKIIYNDQDQEVSSQSDLATILLERPIKNIQPAPLATRQARIKEPVVLAGYGQTQRGELPSKMRRFGMNEVATIEERGATFLVRKPILIRTPYTAKERLLIREKASYSLAGDSGGPCLRKRGGTFELVGIAKTVYGTDHLVEFSEYTSTYAYLDWLRAEIRRAKSMHSD